jgi:hypothetical protein
LVQTTQLGEFGHSGQKVPTVRISQFGHSVHSVHSVSYHYLLHARMAPNTGYIVQS